MTFLTQLCDVLVAINRFHSTVYLSQILTPSPPPPRPPCNAHGNFDASYVHGIPQIILIKALDREMFLLAF